MTDPYFIFDGCVLLTGSVVKERPRAIGRVRRTGGVAERVRTDGCVVVLAHVHIERLLTNGCVVAAAHVHVERPIADGRVEAAPRRGRELKSPSSPSAVLPLP